MLVPWVAAAPPHLTPTHGDCNSQPGGRHQHAQNTLTSWSACPLLRRDHRETPKATETVAPLRLACYDHRH